MKKLIVVFLVVIGCNNPSETEISNNRATITGEANSAVVTTKKYTVTIIDVEVVERGQDTPQISDTVEAYIESDGKPFNLVRDYEFMIEHNGSWEIISFEQL